MEFSYTLRDRLKMERFNATDQIGDYHGFKIHRFDFDACECMVVEPEKPLPGKRWVWKAEFFEAFPKFELEMLRRGFYLGFITVGNTFGCPDALRHWDPFYAELTENHGFDRRPILLGLSRGGLYIYNWAAENCDKVGALYADNPVCDFKSWPGGKGVGPGSPEDWKKLLDDYHFASESEALAYRKNPIDRLRPLVAAGIPLVHAVGTEDAVVPVAENTDVLEKRCRELGGDLRIFRHPGKHHPHGLEDPAPLIEHLLARARRD